MIGIKDARGLVQFSPSDRSLIKAAEEAIDQQIAQGHMSPALGGVPVVVGLPEAITPKIAYELARMYEKNGGWQVERTTEQLRTTLVFFHPTGAAPLEQQPASKAPLVTAINEGPASAYRLLIRMPTRSRPDQALDVIQKYRTMAGVAHTFEVVIDDDDPAMMNPAVLQRLNALGCVITVGHHDSKVAACNAGRVREWDILLLASDDMVPIVDGYGARIVELFEKHWPHLDGALHLNDGYAGERLCTLPLMGRRLYDRLGYVYHGAYQSLYCDNEQTTVFQRLGRIVYVDEKLIEHRHFVTGAPLDALYKRNEALKARDEAIYGKRRDRDFDIAHLLTICVATIPSRSEQLGRLLDHLYEQIRGLDSITLALVDVLVDAGDGTIGAKRQRLLERAHGKYVCFVDDDDFVSHDYVLRILNALVNDPDCVSLCGAMTKNGGEVVMFEHSLKYAQWRFNGGFYERNPNHLSPVRRELALKAGFPDLAREEDRAYSNALRPLLKTEASTGDAPLYYYFWITDK